MEIVPLFFFSSLLLLSLLKGDGGGREKGLPSAAGLKHPWHNANLHAVASWRLCHNCSNLNNVCRGPLIRIETSAWIISSETIPDCSTATISFFFLFPELCKADTLVTTLCPSTFILFPPSFLPFPSLFNPSTCVCVRARVCVCVFLVFPFFVQATAAEEKCFDHFSAPAPAPTQTDVDEQLVKASSSKRGAL